MKKKLTLKLEEMRVEQFQVETARDEARGTVRAYSGGPFTNDVCWNCVDAPLTYTCNGGERR